MYTQTETRITAVHPESGKRLVMWSAINDLGSGYEARKRRLAKLQAEYPGLTDWKVEHLSSVVQMPN